MRQSINLGSWGTIKWILKSAQKRTDGVEDKRRKEAIFKRHGVCIACRNARKQCDGGEVCNRCRRFQHCVLSDLLYSARAKHLACDDVTPCQRTAQITGTGVFDPRRRALATLRPYQQRNPPSEPLLPFKRSLLSRRHILRVIQCWRQNPIWALQHSGTSASKLSTTHNPLVNQRRIRAI